MNKLRFSFFVLLVFSVICAKAQNMRLARAGRADIPDGRDKRARSRNGRDARPQWEGQKTEDRRQRPGGREAPPRSSVLCLLSSVLHFHPKGFT